MRKNRILAAMAMAAMTFASCSTDYETKAGRETERKVEDLLGKMTLEEKIGQMNQLSPWDFGELAAKVRNGEVGSILNYTDPELVDSIQRIAVEESRLGIPLLVARDVVHGYKTILPIPLGQAATFNPEIFSTRRIVVAPLVTVLGFIGVIVGILKNSKDKTTEK